MDSKTKDQPSKRHQGKACDTALTALVRLLARQAAQEIISTAVKTVLYEKQE